MTYYELTSIYGHDTFLLDVNNVGAAMKVRERAAQYSFSHHSHTLATLYYTLFFSGFREYFIYYRQAVLYSEVCVQYTRSIG